MDALESKKTKEMASYLFRSGNQLRLFITAEERRSIFIGQGLTDVFPLISELLGQWRDWVHSLLEFIITEVERDASQAAVVRDRIKRAWQTAQDQVNLKYATDGRLPSVTAYDHMLEIRNTYLQWARYGDIMPPGASQLEVSCRQRLHPLLVAFLLSDPPLRLEFNSDHGLVPLDKPVDTTGLREVLVLPAVYAGDECVCRAYSLFIRSS
jgi:hypothetical protein